MRRLFRQGSGLQASFSMCCLGFFVCLACALTNSCLHQSANIQQNKCMYQLGQGSSSKSYPFDKMQEPLHGSSQNLAHPHIQNPRFIELAGTRLFVARRHLAGLVIRWNLQCGGSLFQAQLFHMQQDLSNSSISCLQVWIRIHTYFILAGGECFVSLALCYGQRHPRYIECSPIN